MNRKTALVFRIKCMAKNVEKQVSGICYLGYVISIVGLI